MSNSISLCNSCAAPMYQWLLKMEVNKGMEVGKEDRVNFNKKGRVDTVYIMRRCPDYRENGTEDEE